MSFNAIAILILVGLFVGMLLCLYVGKRLRQQEQPEDVDRVRLAAVGAAIHGLMRLMIAFTFSGAAQPYELRRQLTVDEANAIGTSYLRLDLLPSSRQVALRQKYRAYTEARLAVYRVLPDLEAS